MASDNPFALKLPSPAVCRAIGEIVTGQQSLELCLSHLLSQILHLPPGTFGALYDSLNNRARVDLILRLAVQAYDDEVADTMAYAIRLFEICTENRNIFAHAAYEERLGRKWAFYKNPTTAGSYGWYFAVSTGDAIAAANEVRAAGLYLGELYYELHRRRLNEPLPLPDRPPQPRKLSLYRLPEDHPIASPQPYSLPR